MGHNPNGLDKLLIKPPGQTGSTSTLLAPARTSPHEGTSRAKRELSHNQERGGQRQPCQLVPDQPPQDSQERVSARNKGACDRGPKLSEEPARAAGLCATERPYNRRRLPGKRTSAAGVTEQSVAAGRSVQDSLASRAPLKTTPHVICLVVRDDVSLSVVTATIEHGFTAPIWTSD